MLEIMYARILSYLKMLKHVLDYGHQSTYPMQEFRKVKIVTHIFKRLGDSTYSVYIYFAS